MDRHTGTGKPALPKLEMNQMPTQADIRDAEQKLYVEYAREIDAYIAKKYPNLVSRRVVSMEDSMEKLIVTSDGSSVHILAPRSYVYIMMTALTDAGTPVDLFKAFGGRGTFGGNFSDPAAMYADIDRFIRKDDNIHLTEDGADVCARQVADMILAAAKN